jgi:hypothetical protein
MIPDTELMKLAAQNSLLMQLVRLLMKERAYANGLTADDVMEHADQIKSFFEGRIENQESAAFLVGAVDSFFNTLASDIRQESSGG